jgi:D-amino-acid oxidase
VIGLSCALEIQEAGHVVTIVAKDFPGPAETIDSFTQINYTSPWGGAHNRWVIPMPGDKVQMHEHELSRITYARMKTLVASNPEAGITFMKGIEYLEKPTTVYEALSAEKAGELGIEGFKLLDKDELPARVQWGCEYRTWCVNPMIYCSFMLRRFTYRGGKIVKREVRVPQEVYSMSDLGDVSCVVNASGVGFGDEKVFPTRGRCSSLQTGCERQRGYHIDSGI